MFLSMLLANFYSIVMDLKIYPMFLASFYSTDYTNAFQ